MTQLRELIVRLTEAKDSLNAALHAQLHAEATALIATIPGCTVELVPVADVQAWIAEQLAEKAP